MTLILLPIETPLVTVKSQTTNGQNSKMILLSPLVAVVKKFEKSPVHAGLLCCEGPRGVDLNLNCLILILRTYVAY